MGNPGPKKLWQRRYDKLFRQTYGDKENARSFLTNYLPGQVLKLLDLSTLEISKDSFIEKELADYYSDILYRVMLKDGSAGFIYLLFEHKSYHDKYIHLQLLDKRHHHEPGDAAAVQVHF